MIVICPNCQKKYRIDASRLSEGNKQMKCTHCSQMISFSKVNSSDQQSQLICLTCPQCKKQYAVPSKRIQTMNSSAKCKACGEMFDVQSNISSDRTTSILLNKIRSPKKKIKKRSRLVPIFICLLLIISAIAGAAIYYTNFKLDFFSKFKSDEASSPYVLLDINVAKVIDIIMPYLNNSNNQFTSTLWKSIIKTMGPDRIFLFICPDPDRMIYPIVIVHGAALSNFEKALDQGGWLSPFIQKDEDGILRIKKEIITNSIPSNSMLNDEYIIRLFENYLLIAPEFRMPSIHNTTEFMNTHVVQFANTIQSDEQLAILSARITDQAIDPENINQTLTHPSFQNLPNAKIAGDIAAKFLLELATPLKSIDSFALGFRFASPHQRMITYAQKFKNQKTGQALFEKMQQQPEKGEHPLVNALIPLLKDKNIKRDISLDYDRLIVKISWEDTYDRELMKTIANVFIGYLFAEQDQGNSAGIPSKSKEPIDHQRKTNQ